MLVCCHSNSIWPHMKNSHYLCVQMVTDEACQGENVRQVLKVEAMLEGGCRELLDKDQALVRQGQRSIMMYILLCHMTRGQGSQLLL